MRGAAIRVVHQGARQSNSASNRTNKGEDIREQVFLSYHGHSKREILPGKEGRDFTGCA